MAERPVDIITISREHGSGGSEIAHGVGERLGWAVLDHDLVHRVAERLRCEDEIVERFDEHPPKLLARIASVLLMAPPELPVSIDAASIPNGDRIAAAARAVIRAAADAPPLVVVGHGAQCIFRGRPDALHVRVVAPLDERVRRLQARHGWDAARARAEAERADADRREYLRRYFQSDLNDPLLYDLQVNTARLTVEQVVELITSVARARHATGGASA